MLKRIWRKILQNGPHFLTAWSWKIESAIERRKDRKIEREAQDVKAELRAAEDAARELGLEIGEVEHQE